jgi:hypothetical protein
LYYFFILFTPHHSAAEIKNFVVYGYNSDPSYKTNHIRNNNSIPADSIFIQAESLHDAITGILNHLGTDDTIGDVRFRNHGNSGIQSVG